MDGGQEFVAVAQVVLPELPGCIAERLEQHGDRRVFLLETQCFFFFSSRRRHTRFSRDWSSDVCSSDLVASKALSSAVVILGIGASVLERDCAATGIETPGRRSGAGRKSVTMTQCKRSGLTA